MAIPDPQIDQQHCAAIVHEYLRCKDSFIAFASLAEGIIVRGAIRHDAYRAYNAYSDFILHLYEFLIALHARDLGVPEITVPKGKQKSQLLDALIHSTTTRMVERKIYCIENGIAPSWENHISVYEDMLPVPKDFSVNFRRMRNKIGGHVTYERINEINLTIFYEENHNYLYLLYRECGDFWDKSAEEFPDLEKITDFFGAISRRMRPNEGRFK
jgi:hypothetical protein